MANTIIAVDSMTKLPDQIIGRVLVAGSHGGVYPAYLAAKSQVRGIILNDAGGGKDDAGFASLTYLEVLGIPAATCSHVSACIGDGRDMLRRGRISRVNTVAAKLVCLVHQGVGEAAELMRAAQCFEIKAPVYEESRVCLSRGDGGPIVWGVDSASLVRPEDEGQIMVTGSHGGLLGGDIATAIRVHAAACAFNDAGVGANGVGYAPSQFGKCSFTSWGSFDSIECLGEHSHSDHLRLVAVFVSCAPYAVAYVDGFLYPFGEGWCGKDG